MFEVDLKHCLNCGDDLKIIAVILEMAVIGLYTMFEHHAVTSPGALRVFLHEYRIGFQVGIDVPGGPVPMPCTMQAYRMMVAPTLLVFERQGKLQLNQLCQVGDLLAQAS